MVVSYSRRSGLRATQQDSLKCILPFSPGAHMDQRLVWLARKRCNSVRHILPSKPMPVAFQSKTNRRGAAVCAEPAGPECIDCQHV
jgi:hypothetical protein